MSTNELAGLAPIKGVSAAQHELITSCISSAMDQAVTDPALIEAVETKEMDSALGILHAYCLAELDARYERGNALLQDPVVFAKFTAILYTALRAEGVNA